MKRDKKKWEKDRRILVHSSNELTRMESLVTRVEREKKKVALDPDEVFRDVRLDGLKADSRKIPSLSFFSLLSSPPPPVCIMHRVVYSLPLRVFHIYICKDTERLSPIINDVLK